MAAKDQEFVLLGDDDVRDFNPEGLLPLAEDKVLQLREWLAPTDYSATSSEWGKHRTSHLVGTGTWIMDTEQYQQWHNSDRGGLWIKAVAGAGKSVIAATIISKLAAEEKVPILYFFFRHIVSANQTPKSLIRDFSAQVLQYSPQLQNNLFKIMNDERRSLDSVSSDELWNMLVHTLTQLPRAYCIIDALDEMDTEHESFLSKLAALAQQAPASVKVLMTSRPMPRIERHFRNSDVSQLVLQPQLINPDISTFVTHRMDELMVPPEIRFKIHDTMCTKSDGHFLYARLMMDNLLDTAKNTVSDEQTLLKAVKELPSPMADMYTQMLSEHSQRSQTPQNLQVEILQWVTRAERPLRLLELSSLIDTRTFMPQVAKDAKSIIREACGPLLEIFEDETVHPIHHSFTEYLYDETRLELGSNRSTFPVLNYGEAQQALTLTCLARLSSGWHTQRPASMSSPKRFRTESDILHDRNTMKLKYPYLDYAAKYWDCHLRKSGANTDSISNALHEIFISAPDLLRAILDWSLPNSFQIHNPEGGEICDKWSPLHAAADKGIVFLVESLLQKHYDLEQLTGTEHTPLALAALNGHHDVVQVLLKYGAKNDEPDNCGLKPLHHAARSNHWEVVKLLLEAGVDPYTPKTREDAGRSCGMMPTTTGDTPVRYACAFGHMQTMKVIVPFLKSERLQQALYWALRYCQTEIVIEVLRRPDIDVNYYFDNHTPLYLASRFRDLKVMRLLLTRGADPDLLSCQYIKSEHGHGQNFRHDCRRNASPLHAFAERQGNEYPSQKDETSVANMLKGYQMLLDVGIDPNILDPKGSTILHAILGEPNQSSISVRISVDQTFVKPTLTYLSSRGLSLRSLTSNGSNALHLVQGVTVDVLDMLIDHGVDVNAVRKKDGETPLMTALAKGEVAIVRHFLKSGANVNITDHYGNTVLHIAQKLFRIDVNVVKDLIAAGADVNAKNKDGDTALHIGSFKPELANLFVQQGFDLESRNKLGQSLLFQSVAWLSSIEVYETLMEFGCDPLTRDIEGRSILHALIPTIHDVGMKTSDVVQYFVERGVDPRSTDTKGNNLWHVMAGAGANQYQYQADQIAVMSLLTKYGVSLTARNMTGQTPFHMACSVHQSFSYGPLKFLFDHAKIDVNVSDYDQVRPLHLAASFNCRLTCALLERGADCTTMTIEGQTPLMIACRTRQCNIVCALLYHYRQKGLLHLIDQNDRTGQTALHHACRSGRPEIVSLLLEAGADPNSKDNHNVTPLHACATYLDEDASWQRFAQSLASGTIRPNRASYVLSTDPSRPVCETRYHSADDPIRIRETIRRLFEYGAETSSLITQETPNLPISYEWPNIHIDQQVAIGSPFAYAITRCCGPMISELLLIQEKFLQAIPNENEVLAKGKQGVSNTPTQKLAIRESWLNKLDSFRVRAKLLKMQYMPNVIADSVRVGKANFFLAQEALKDDDELSLREIAELGACFSLLEVGGENVPDQLASWGFADLLSEFAEHAAHMTAAWTRDMAAQNPNWQKNRLKSILYTALTRAIPNMAVVQIVISKFQHDVNEMFADGFLAPNMHSYVHVLATAPYWWQTEALAYLLDHGADVDLLDSNGDTPLVCALKASYMALDHNYGHSHDPITARIVEVLLSHGANPNMADRDGLTCLNLAARQPKCIRLLLKHGADPNCGTKSFLIDAINAQDLDTIKILIASGTDLNRTSQPNNHSKDTSRSLEDMQEWCGTNSLENLCAHAYPLHVAASRFFNLPDKIDKARDIIDSLLKGGANPFLTYRDGSSILHCLFRHGGIIEPFLSLPSFDVELRDGKGRTFLLAACAKQQIQLRGHRWNTVENDAIPTLIRHGASLDAVDNEGRNALHHLVDTGSRDGFEMEKRQSVLKPFLPSLLYHTDFSGRTPYHYAASTGDIHLIQLLLDHGSNPFTPDPIDKTTTLHHLAPKLVAEEVFVRLDDNWVQMNRLTAAGLRRRTLGKVADDEKLLEQLDKTNQQSPRHLLASLLARGLSINDKDNSGETPLFKLARAGALAAYWVDWKDENMDFGLLLSALHTLEKSGADFKARNHSAESVLHVLAKQGEHVSIHHPYHRDLDAEAEAQEKDLRESVKWLISKGADVTWEDNEQRTCLDVAAASGATWLTKMYERER